MKKDKLPSFEKKLFKYSLAATGVLTASSKADASVVVTNVNKFEKDIMINPFTESFDKRLLKYSLAAGTVLAGVNTANAAVSGTIDNVILNTSSNYNIQFNGATKFTISFISSGLSEGTLICKTPSAAFIKTGNYVKPLGSGSVVNSSKSFLYNNSYNGYFFSKSAGTSFLGNDPKYIGVKFKDGGTIKYGYIKVYVAANASFVKIYGHAYETSGGPITTDTNLPVELTTFTADNLGSKVELKWNTATEVNNYGFEVERQMTNDNNGHWTSIGFVKGNGNSNSPKDYSFVDTNPLRGKVEYRLKQIDNDGAFKYSQIVTVNSLPAKFELSQNYPNPFNPSTAINYSIPKAEHVTLKVYDELGKEVSTLVDENEEAGNYEVQFNSQQTTDNKQLASGIYYYRITTGDFTEVKKLMLLK